MSNFAVNKRLGYFLLLASPAHCAMSPEAISADAVCSPADSSCALNAVQVAKQKAGLQPSAESSEWRQFGAIMAGASMAGANAEGAGSSEDSSWPAQKLISTDALDPLKTMQYQPDGPDPNPLNPTGQNLFPGIWWMDQYGTNLPTDDYPYFFPGAAPEILFTTAKGIWVQGADGPKPGVSPCLWPLAGGGVTPENTWAYVNTNGLGWNFYWPLLNPPPAGFYTGEGPEQPSNPAFKGYGLYFCPYNDTVINIPINGLSEALFVKKEWGYDRITRFPFLQSLGFFGDIIGYSMSFFMNFIPAFRGVGIVNLAKDQHYPVFQIIDGKGQKTKNFEKYAAFINKRKSCLTVQWLPPFSWFPSWWPAFLVPSVGKANYCNQGPGSMVYATNATWNTSKPSFFFR